MKERNAASVFEALKLCSLNLIVSPKRKEPKEGEKKAGDRILNRTESR